MSTPLRGILDAAVAQSGLSMKDLTVLSACRDPYRLDTKAGHAKGKWLADSYAEVNPSGRRLHLRGLHYLLVGRVKLPNGQPYINDDKTWTWMSEQAAKCARFLGYLPWDALRDARNSPPQVFRVKQNPPSWQMTVGEVDVWLPETLEPRVSIVGDLYRQPWQQILIAEKQGVSDVLLPLAKQYSASLVLPGGELSDQMLHDILKEAAEDGRPLAIHQLGDFDPAGYQMAISTARTAQALRDSQFPDLTIRVHPVALTLKHCLDWNLPSTPLKETELRANRWQEAMGREQTELDAAVALVPSEFTSVIRDSLKQYFDEHVQGRAAEIRRDLEDKANVRLAEHLGDETLALIRYQAEAKLADLDDLVKEVNAALRFDFDDLGIALPDSPTVLDGTTKASAEPLYDSDLEWGFSTLRMIERKQYCGDAA